MHRAIALLALLLTPSAHAWLRDNYVGDASCQTCHSAQSASFAQTNHHRTSAAATAESILGHFNPGDNLLKTANPNLYFQMDAKPTGFFQSSVAGTPPHTRSERFAFVVGSGEKGQTYLFWDDDQLFQLPVSFWADLGWVNSPGYRDGFADFERAIIPRCLECHADFARATGPPSNRYDAASLQLGIGCEKCHGPGKQHTEWAAAKPATDTSTHIVNPEHFTREQQMDLCAWCHAGHGQPLKPAFSYLPGAALDQYLHLASADASQPLDVHGNQVELLKRSRCYLASAMTCLTCHNVHAPQHDLVDFSKRCLTCHKPDAAVFRKANHPLVANCIDCHMPKQETNLIVFNTNGKMIKPPVRNHWIKVY